MEASALLRPFAELGMESRPLVGGKGASLGELTALASTFRLGSW